MQQTKNEIRTVAVLGATGSIGTSTLEVIEAHPERWRVAALTAGSNVEKLADLVHRWQPATAVIADPALYDAFQAALQRRGVTEVSVQAGPEAIERVAGAPDSDIVVQGIVGAAAVAPTFAAVRAGKRLLLANKESVVCGGELLMQTVRDCGAELLPVDSEHNAIFQCLQGADPKARETATLWLTCSGGPFHAHPEIDLSTVELEQALAHPTWTMGRKITIDSATLMNKGLEVIEAHHLFHIPPERIRVAIHPQSIVHSMVEFEDGALLAELGRSSMKLPIAYCLGYPERLEAGVQKLDLFTMGRLEFFRPDMQRFPQLAYAYEALATGGIASIVLNAANEIGVEAFLARRIRFTGIAALCRAMLDTITGAPAQSVEEILAVDARVRAEARAWIARNA